MLRQLPLVLFASACLCAYEAANASLGYLEFDQPILRVKERRSLVNINVVRKGGTAGIIITELKVVLNGTNATQGEDFEFFWNLLVWNFGDDAPKSATFRILDDSRFEFLESIKIAFKNIDPAAAVGVQNQELLILIERDDDGGTFQFTNLQPMAESKPLARTCILSVNRVRGSSGLSSVWLENTPCLGNVDNPAEPMIDFEFFGGNASSPMLWGDGETDERCALYSLVTYSPDLAPNESGLLALEDAMPEKDEIICLTPRLGKNSTATLGQQQIMFRLNDLGRNGGFLETCYRGADCTLNWPVATSQIRGGDKLYFSGGGCLSCSDYEATGVYLQFADMKDVDFFTYSFGRGFDWSSPGNVQLCLCRHPERNLGRAVLIGDLYLLGPNLRNSEKCVRGQPRCQITELSGRYDLGARGSSEIKRIPGTEYVQILVDCQQPNTTYPELARYARAASSDVFSFVFNETRILAAAAAGIYHMCWCRVNSVTNCSRFEDFDVEAGLFVLAGPYYKSDEIVVINQTWPSFEVSGIELTDEDVTRVMVECGVDKGPSMEANVSSDILRYDFGVPTSDRIKPGEYSLCWCQRIKFKENGEDKVEGCEKPEDFIASFGKVYVMCPPKFAINGETGECSLCEAFYLTPSEDQTTCVLDGVAIAHILVFYVLCWAAFSYVFEQLTFACLGKKWTSTRLVGRKIYIEDVKKEGDKLILKTKGKHSLLSYGRCFPVLLLDTGHYQLDDASRRPMARVNGPSRLELLDSKGQPFVQRADTSKGVLVLSAHRMLLHTVACERLPLLFTVLILFGSAFGQLFSVEAPVPSFEFAFLLFLISGVQALVTILLRRFWRTSTLLAERLLQFDQELSLQNPNPSACDRGPGRAVSAFQLFTLFDFFAAFIQDRTMYYLDPNIIRPLCNKYKLSYAERAGPHEVQWFISHFWGTQFRVFCEAVRRHAVATSGDEGGDTWKQSTYWICTFSNNQYKIEEELGHSHHDSSFYLALHSGKCKGTCMILDEQALPLTRSWCLFELLTTINLEKVQSGFHGLLFCTETGVLNYGAATVEVSMNIGKKLAALSVENADATSAKDKQMINSLVIQEMGSFKAIDNVLRTHIRDALQVCQEQVNNDFGGLFNTLKRASRRHDTNSSVEAEGALQV